VNPRNETCGPYDWIKKAGAVATAVIAILALGTMVGGWAWSEIQKPVKEEAKAREVSIAKLIEAQNQTNETLVELVTVMVAPTEIKARTMRRLQAKYEIGVTR
jgi:hypothetical protein